MLFPLSKPAANTESEKLNWLRLFRTENVGPITFYRLIENFGSATAALDALPEMAKRGGRKKPLVAPSMSDIEREYAALRKLGGDMVTAGEKAYPLALSAIDDAPPVISVIGNIDLLNQPCVGIVGARNASLNGKKFAQKLARDLGAQEQVIVSGLARGIDTAAHEGALETGTIAVVAGGIDIVYPEENQKLYEQICERGLIIAESPLGQKPFAQSFPKRNRIVSGLSSGIIVVEATKKSGSLITARMAGEQGRDIFAVPGHPLDPRASGPNHLIREGATLIGSAADVMESITNFIGKPRHMHEPKAPPTNFMQPANMNTIIPENGHDIVLDQLSFMPVAVDELLRACEMSVPVMQIILLELELAGRIKRLPGNRVCLIGE